MHYYYYYLIPLFLLITMSTATAGERHHQCTDNFHAFVKARNLSNCHRLPTLGAELGWSNPIISSEKSHHVAVRVMLGAPLDEDKGWLAWGVNPGPHPEMVGTRAAIGIKDPSNRNKGVYCNTYNVTYETRIGCQLRPSPLDEIKCLGFEYNVETRYHVLTANLNLSTAEYNVSNLKIVWQIGSDVDGDEPKRHVATLRNVDSVETVDLITGKSSDIAHVKIYLRQVHGILNIIGWGTFLPVGVIIARFFKKFPFESEVWWFYTHVGCQCTAFLIGVVGWGIGIWLAHASPRYIFRTHHVFGIFIFVFATLQTLAIRFKPKIEDDFRKVWNIYHHFLGYALLALIFINIFEGIRILKPENNETWRLVVIGILVALGAITLILECHTWRKFIGENKKKNSKCLTASSKPDEEDERGIQAPFPRRNALASSPALALAG